jgi:hypothetical protein
MMAMIYSNEDTNAEFQEGEAKPARPSSHRGSNPHCPPCPPSQKTVGNYRVSNKPAQGNASKVSWTKLSPGLETSCVSNRMVEPL